MVLCGTKNGSSMASLEESFEAPLETIERENKVTVEVIITAQFNTVHTIQ